ncbi:MAG: helix-turn-helix domain-containing protein, partial [Patescibacteria group bacterium]
MTSLLQENLISTKEASEFSGYHSDYLARMCRAGKIEGRQVGRTWLVSRESVEVFMRDQEARKRELADSLSKKREEEYQKVKTETVKEVVEEVAAPITPAAPIVVTPRASTYHASARSKPVVSPYVSHSNPFATQALAVAVTVAVLGGSIVFATSSVPQQIAQIATTGALAVENTTSDAGESLLAFGALLRDGSFGAPVALASVNAYQIPLAAFAFTHGLGENISSFVATGIVSAPYAYEAGVTESVLAFTRAGETMLAVENSLGAAIGTFAYDAADFAGIIPSTESSRALALESATNTASAASAFAPPTFESTRDWFLNKGEYLARTTYGSFSIFYDWAGYAVASIIDPYANRFPIVMVDYPLGGGAGTPTSIVNNTGPTTVVQNIYPTYTTETEGASIAYVDQWVARLQNSINRNAENNSGGGGGGITEVSGDITVDSITVTNNGSIGGDLTVTNNGSIGGDLTVTGTLTVGSFVTGQLSTGLAIEAPYFTATSTTATSSFAGGFYAKRVEAGDYLAGPYVLATSTTATSVFSGNIAANGNTTIGDAGSDSLTINAGIASSLTPSAGSTYDLGSASVTWRNAYVDTLFASNASSTNATSTNLVATNFTVGGSTFSSFLGNALTNVGGVLSVSTSSLASGFFQNGGNSFGAAGVIGTNDAQSLTIETNNLPRITVDSSGQVGIGTSTPGSLLSLGGIANFTTATSTFFSSGGINITNGCFAVNGTCITAGGGGGGSGTVNAGTAGQIAYYDANGTAVTGTSSAFVATNGNVGVGTSSPYAKLSVAGQVVAEYFTASSLTGTSTLPLLEIAQALQLGSDYITDLTGSGLIVSAGALTIDRTGDWTGTFDGQQGTYYLDRANHTGQQLASTISDFASTARGLLSSSATGLSYDNSTGVFSLTSGYVIPLSASTTEWASAYVNRITSATYPLQIASNVISLAFGTTTSNTWAGTQTFANLGATNATTTSLGINSETFTDLTGTGLQNVGGALTLNATGDWTGTFDGQQGTYYLDRANHTGQQLASTIS